MISKIQLNKDIIYNREISNNAKIVYVGLRLLTNNKFTNSDIACALYGEENKSKFSEMFVKRNISQGLKELQDKGIVCYEDKRKYKLMDLSQLNVYENGKRLCYFITIEIDEIRRILNLKTQVNKIELLLYFITLVSTFESFVSSKGLVIKNIVGCQNVKTLSSMCNINEQLISRKGKYNSILMNNQLIYIQYCDYIFFKKTKGKKSFKSIPNVYSRWNDIQFAKMKSEQIVVNNFSKGKGIPCYQAKK